MSLPPGQCRALRRIENTIHVSDPALASLFTLFGQLSQDETLPGAEQLRPRAWLMLSMLRSRPAANGHRLRDRLSGWKRTVLVYSLTVLALAAIVVLIVPRPGSARCGTGATASATRHGAMVRSCGSTADAQIFRSR